MTRSEALEEGLQSGRLRTALRPFRALETAQQAQTLVAALDRMPGSVAGALFGPLEVVATYYHDAEQEDVVEVLRGGFGRFLALYDRALALDARASALERRFELLFALKVFAMWPHSGGPDALRRLVDAARDVDLRDGDLWPVIFAMYARREHPFLTAVVAGLSDPLLVDGSVALSFLDLVNALCREGRLARHPHGTQVGLRWLAEGLGPDGDAGRAHSAAAAIPFLAVPARATLLEAASRHHDQGVRMEAAWADARCGGTTGTGLLVNLCGDPHATRTAQTYLRELGRDECIPATAHEPDFKAMAELSSWLQNPRELGRAPDRMSLRDTRELFWTPRGDRRRVWLFEFHYDARGPDEPARSGLGMVGSITFALLGEVTLELLPEDAYGLHCCWELQQVRSSLAPRPRSAEAGRKLLGL